MATLVALLFGGFVITGLLAWSVDAGQVFWERRQTQNAADAAALALAQSCAKSNCNVGADSLQDLVNANTINHPSRTHPLVSQPLGQCKVNWTAGNLPLCTTTPSVSDLSKCPPFPSGLPANLPYVEVRVRANEGGQPLIPNPFSKLNNSAADDTSDVGSCARAAWGTPKSGTFTSPVTLSTCEWQTYTNGGTTYVAQPPVAPWPGYGGAGQPAWPPAPTTPDSPGHEVVIKLHDPGVDGCYYNGKDTAGGFGYLDTSGSCSSTLTTVNGVDYWANVDTGASPTTDCKTALSNIWTNGPVIDLPVFDCMIKSTTGTPTGAPPADCDPANAGGANTYYHVAGVARFYLSGYNLPSATKNSRTTGSPPCSPPDKCISGWFLQGVLSNPTGGLDPPDPSHPGFGLSAVIAAG